MQSAGAPQVHTQGAYSTHRVVTMDTGCLPRRPTGMSHDSALRMIVVLKFVL